jgi:hypothetical protein
MPEENHRRRKVKESLKVVGVKLVACDETAEVEEPREETLDLPAATVSTQGSTVLSRALSVRAVWRDELDSALLHQPTIQCVAVVSLVADQPLGLFVDQHLVQRLLDQRYFVGRSACDPKGERKTSAVCDCHDLGPLSFLRFPDARPPFLAPAKEPSMNVSLRSKPPLSLKSRANAWRSRSSVPSWTHC